MRTAILLLTLVLTACQATSKLPEGQDFGEKLEARTIHKFALLDAEPAKFFNQTLLVEGTVKAVCLKKGCWMQIEDQGRVAMVRWESGCGGKYAFPMDSAGKRILIQGSFYPKQITAEDAEHLQEEAGGKLELKLDGYEFNASAVRILN